MCNMEKRSFILVSKQFCFQTQRTRWLHEWTGEKILPIGPRCNCVTLQRCCLQRLQEYCAKSFSLHYTSVAAFRLQARCPSWSSQRQSAEIQCKASWSFLRYVFVAGQGIEGKNMGTKAAKFLWQPDLYVGHIAGQAYALVSEKLQRLDQSVGGHDLSRFGQLFSSPKPKKGWGAKCNWHKHTEIVEEFLSAVVFAGRAQKTRSKLYLALSLPVGTTHALCKLRHWAFAGPRCWAFSGPRCRALAGPRC